MNFNNFSSQICFQNLIWLNIVDSKVKKDIDASCKYKSGWLTTAEENAQIIQFFTV